MYFKISTQWLSITIVCLGCELPIISTENMCILDQPLVKVGVESGGIMFFVSCNTSRFVLRMKAVWSKGPNFWLGCSDPLFLLARHISSSI